MTLHINAIPELCSISPGWIEATERSSTVLRVGVAVDRAAYRAGNQLDELIAEFGRPRFCRIDVEGSEVEVLEGATVPVDFF